MILYLHGLASTGNSSTKKRLIDHGFDVHAPTYSPENYNQTLELMDDLKQQKWDLIVGTSFGGYWATYLGGLTHSPIRVFNPLLNPAPRLKELIENEEIKHPGTGVVLKCTNQMAELFPGLGNQHINALKSNGNDYLIYSGSEDELVPTQLIQQFCLEHNVDFQVLEGLGHRTDDNAIQLLANDFNELVSI